jgi:hypothetical protein
MAKARKVFWDESERQAIAMRAIELHDNKLYDSPLLILRAAMAALPPSRRRKVRSLAEVSWFEPLVNEMLANRLKGDASDASLINAIRDGNETQRGLLSEIIKELRTHTSLLTSLSKPAKH